MKKESQTSKISSAKAKPLGTIEGERLEWVMAGQQHPEEEFEKKKRISSMPIEEKEIEGEEKGDLEIGP